MIFIMYCPQRQYFPEFVQHHINTRNNFQRPRSNSYSNFYNPSWPEHQNHMWVGSHQPFEQPHAPTKADWEIAVDKLLQPFKQSAAPAKSSLKIFLEKLEDSFQTGFDQIS